MSSGSSRYDDYAAAAGSTFGLIGQMAGSFYSAKAQRVHAGLQAFAAAHNARLAERRAQSALAAGQKEVVRHSLRAGSLAGMQRAAQAAGGVDLSVGSAAQVRADSELLAGIDRNQIEQNALMQAWGYRMQADDFAMQEQMARLAARQASPAMSAFATLLTGAGQVASGWYQAVKGGGGDPVYALYQKTNNWGMGAKR